MIELQEAVKSAKAAAIQFLAEDTVLDELMLEEVELDEVHNAWLITLGFNIPEKNSSRGIGALIGQQFKRKYKVFQVDVESGQVKSMKIREV